MAKILDVFVPGRPKATPRPRAFANKDGKVRAYKPNTAESWKTEIAIGLRKHRLKTPAEGPIRVDLVFYMPRPKEPLPDRKVHRRTEAVSTDLSHRETGPGQLG